MKIQSSGGVVETSEVKQSGNFTIKATGKAFAILSSGLYTNKILAIVRELSCNAYDAHVSAYNTDTPFVVKLPNRIDPSFAIRDYGIALSHDRVMNLYTTYFESTKTESNDFIGALGLGSKSPFSYTSSFTVESFFEGRHGVYTAYIGKDGLPAITLMSEDDTEEPNGLRVSFPVKESDISSFAQEARNVYRYFKVVPQIGGNEITVTPVEYSVGSGDDWGYRGGDDVCRAIMGNVAYPITTSAMKLDADSTSDKVARLRIAKALKILSAPMDIRFNIGDCDVTASRESLSYDEGTIERLIDRAVLVFDDVISNANIEVDAIDNLWDAIAYLDNITNVKTGFPYFIRNMNQVLTTHGSEDDAIVLRQWRGRKLPDNTLLLSKNTFDGEYEFRTIEAKCNRNGRFSKFIVRLGHDSQLTSSDSFNQTFHTYRVRPAKTLAVYVNDQGRAGLARCRKHFTMSRNSMGAEDVVVILTYEPALEKAKKHRMEADPVLFKARTDAAIANMCYNPSKVIYASAIVLPRNVEAELKREFTPKVREKRFLNGRASGLFEFTPQYSYNGSNTSKMNSWRDVPTVEAQEKFLKDGGYFVYLDGYDPMLTAEKTGTAWYMGDAVNTSQLKNLRDLMVRMKLLNPDDKIYGVRRSFVKNLTPATKNLRSAAKVVEKIIDSQLSDTLAWKEVNGLNFVIENGTNGDNKRAVFNVLTEERMARKVKSAKLPEGTIPEFYQQYREYVSAKKKAELRCAKYDGDIESEEFTGGLRAARSILGIETHYLDKQEKFKNMVNDIGAKLEIVAEEYPLMVVPMARLNDQVIGHVVEYVKMVGTSNQTKQVA